MSKTPALMHSRFWLAAGVLIFLSLPAGAVQDFEAEKLRVASAQHEIIQLLLKERRFEDVLPELDKILSLGISTHEDKVVAEVRLVSDRLFHERRVDLAIQALEHGIRGVAQNKSKSELYQELGYVYRLQGRDVKAMECFRKAKEYAEKLSIRP